MVLLDTCFLIDILKNRQPAVDILSEKESHETLWVATPSITELWEGALNSDVPEKEKKKIDELIAGLEILDFDIVAAKKTAEIAIALRNNPIELEDMMIAAIAFARWESVITRDAHFARIPGLRVLKY
ncbi:PIN domain-containing protein [Candidatus Woesearchaeota archaeon]|nr:PIN domain-containing protein [Candidatus Woesearchaeota archaeon]